jgi:hypothetical protein
MAVAQVHADEPIKTIPVPFRDARCIANLHGFMDILSVKELNRMATHRLLPKMPSRCRCEGTVVVKVVVDELGHMDCVSGVHGHPILVKSVLDALSSWKFRPYTANGRPKSVEGLLAFRFSTANAKPVRLDKGVRAMPEDPISQP